MDQDHKDRVDPEPEVTTVSPRGIQWDRRLRELDEGIARVRRAREESEYWGRVARERGE